MKNKKSIYLLAPLSLFIWGWIGYTVFKTVNPSIKTQISKSQKFKAKSYTKIQPFEINANYRDPFLGTPSTPLPKKIKPKTISKPAVVFPNIVYNGTIGTKKNKESVFLISINGKQEMLKKNETAQNIKLLHGNATSITILYQNVKKTIKH